MNIPFTTFDDKESNLVKSVALGKLGAKKKAPPSFVQKVWNSMVKMVSANNSNYFGGEKACGEWTSGINDK